MNYFYLYPSHCCRLRLMFWRGRCAGSWKTIRTIVHPSNTVDRWSTRILRQTLYTDPCNAYSFSAVTQLVADRKGFRPEKKLTPAVLKVFPGKPCGNPRTNLIWFPEKNRPLNKNQKYSSSSSTDTGLLNAQLTHDVGQTHRRPTSTRYRLFTFADTRCEWPKTSATFVGDL